MSTSGRYNYFILIGVIVGVWGGSCPPVKELWGGGAKVYFCILLKRRIKQLEKGVTSRERGRPLFRVGHWFGMYSIVFVLELKSTIVDRISYEYNVSEILYDDIDVITR